MAVLFVIVIPWEAPPMHVMKLQDSAIVSVVLLEGPVASALKDSSAPMVRFETSVSGVAAWDRQMSA